MITRPQRHADEGVTLVEMTVAMLLFSIVTAVAFNFLNHATNITSKADSDSRLEQSVQIALRTVTEDLRGAKPIGAACTTATDAATPPLPAGYDNCVQFTVVRTTSATSTSCPMTVFVYALVGGNLVEDRTNYNAACTSTGSFSRKVLLDNVVNTSSQPLFVYYGTNGSAIDTTNNPAAVPKATSVRVQLWAKYNSKSAVIPYFSVATIRNDR